MIELLDADLKNDLGYQEINKELIEICKISHSPQEAVGLSSSHYMIDYPWLFVQIPALDRLFFKNTKILDAGCGRGIFQIFLAKRFELYTADRRGSHIEEWSKEKEKQFDVDLRFSCQDLKCTNYENDFFDHIVSCSSFEHNSFEDAKLVFKEMDRILKPGGRIVFTLVAYKEFKTIYGRADDPIITCYTKEKIKELFENTNLKLLEDTDNFDKFDDLFLKFCNKYPVYGKHYIPVGVVVQKGNI